MCKGYRNRHKVPPELVAIDHKMMLPIATLMMNQCPPPKGSVIDLKYSLGSKGSYIRRFKVDNSAMNMWRRIHGDSRRESHSTAIELVEKRFDIPRNTIKDQVRRMESDGRIKTTRVQGLAVAVYFDLIMGKKTERLIGRHIELLAHLSASGISPITLYYLIECAQTVWDKGIVAAPPDVDIQKLCQMLNPTPDQMIMSFSDGT